MLVTGLETLLSRLKLDKDLERLWLDGNCMQRNRIPGNYPTFIEIFLLQNSVIKVLSLRGSQVDDHMAEALGKGLIKNFTLLELHLSGNAITVRPCLLPHSLSGLRGERDR